HCHVGHISTKLKEKTDAQSHAHSCDRVAVRRIGGAYRRRANLARGQQHRRCCTEFHADRTGGVPGMGTLLSAGICSRVRSVPMLVSSLLVMDMRRRGPPHLAAPFAPDWGGVWHDPALPGVVTRADPHGRRLEKALART